MLLLKIYGDKGGILLYYYLVEKYLCIEIDKKCLFFLFLCRVLGMFRGVRF